MGEEQSKMKPKSSAEGDFFQPKPNKPISKKSPNNCEVHESQQINSFCSISNCKALMCPSCYKSHIHKKKEEISEDLLSKFRFLKFLGKGGCGKVFAVQQNFEDFAIKVVDVFGDVEESVTEQQKQMYLEEYMKEVQIHQILRQQYIISYYDHFYIESEERLVIKMELAESSLAVNFEDLDKDQALVWFAQICSGVNYLHEKNIIHRDLKPGNVLIKENKVKICDFGGAKLMTQTRVSRSRKNEEAFLGTQEYLAPEIFSQDVKKFTKSSDIWALGIILFKMLNQGKHPFLMNVDKMDRDEKIEHIKNKMDEYMNNQVKMKKMVKEIYMGDVIAKCLQYEAMKRIEIHKLIDLVQQKLDEAGIQISTFFNNLKSKGDTSQENSKKSKSNNTNPENINKNDDDSLKIKSKTINDCLGPSKTLNEISKANPDKNKEEEDEEKSMTESSENCNSKANKYFLDEKYEKALKEYDLALSINPSAKYHCNKASCLIRMNSFNEALQSVNKCLKMDSKYVKGYARKGLILLKQKEFESASKVFQEGLNLDKRNKDCTEGLASIPEEKILEALRLRQKAEEFYIEARFKEALADISEAIKLNSKNGMFFIIKARCLYKIKEYDQAITAAKQAIELDSSCGKDSFEIQADSLINLKRIDEAINCYNIALKADPCNQKLKTNLQKAKQASNDQLYDKSNNFQNAKNYQSALDCINQALNIYPENIKYIFKKAVIQDESGDKKGALQTLISILNIDKTNPEAFLLIGKIFLDLNFVPLSLQVFTEGLNSNPQHQGLLLSKKTVSQMIEKANVVNREGVSFFGDGKYLLALNKFDEAININPGQANFHHNRAHVLHTLDNPNAALEACKKCLQIDKNFIKGYALEGTIYLALNNKSAAEQAFREGLNIDPDNDECRNGLNGMKGNKNANDLLGLLLLEALLKNNQPAPQQQSFFLNRNNNNFFDF